MRATPSKSAIASCGRTISVAARFSGKGASDEVPGIGRIFGERCSRDQHEEAELILENVGMGTAGRVAV